jgi:hypothetical protein
MLNSGVIIRSKSPWSSAVVPVHKKEGSIRFIVDYRLNAINVYIRCRALMTPWTLLVVVATIFQFNFWILTCRDGSAESVQTAFITLDGCWVSEGLNTKSVRLQCLYSQKKDFKMTMLLYHADGIIE